MPKSFRNKVFDHSLCTYLDFKIKAHEIGSTRIMTESKSTTTRSIRAPHPGVAISFCDPLCPSSAGDGKSWQVCRGGVKVHSLRFEKDITPKKMMEP